MTAESQIESIIAPFKLSDDQLRKISQLLLGEMKKGLGADTNASADLKMIPTYVRTVPKGDEVGKFLALDLGGTNFRVLLINLQGRHAHVSSKIYNIPYDAMTGTGEYLFDHIADCMYQFMKSEGILDQVLPLGFTFSFPCRQIGLAEATLSRWTKGFRASGVEREEVSRKLSDAIKRRGDFKVDIVALLNDTTGALMACAHSSPNCFMGLILGTGCNACYVERLENVELWDGDFEDPKEVMINMEWGAFGENGALDFIRTEFDRSADSRSIKPGAQIYEKMISGMYLGELVRLVLVKLAEERLVLDGKLSERLKTKDAFYTKYLSEIESEPEGTYIECAKILNIELDVQNPTEEDCRIVREVCSAVSHRAALLAGIGVATVVNHMNRPSCTIGVDGSLYKFHPKLQDDMVECMKKFVDPKLQFNLQLAEDGSGKGAALVAAVATAGT